MKNFTNDTICIFLYIELWWEKLSKRRKYSEEDPDNALTEIKDNEMYLGDSRPFGVPKQTLSDKLVSNGKTRGFSVQ